MDRYTIRQPIVSELEMVQVLRHDVLDPARLKAVDHELSDKDFADDTIHMAAFQGAAVVCTVRLDLVASKPNIYEVRKMAASPAARRNGLGSKVLKAAMLEAASRGVATFRLDARAEAIPFFEKNGFVQSGEMVVREDGVPNYVMTS